MSRSPQALITGPGCEGRAVPEGLSAALALAQDLAHRAFRATKVDATWYVRDSDGAIRWQVSQAGTVRASLDDALQPSVRRPARGKTALAAEVSL